MTAPNDFNWEDPNLMIGDTNKNFLSPYAYLTKLLAGEEGVIRRFSYDFEFSGEKISVIQHPLGVSYVPENFSYDTSPRWVLSKDPDHWHLIPTPSNLEDLLKRRNPELWGKSEFIQEIIRLPLIGSGEVVYEEHKQKINGHYLNLSLGLKFIELPDSPEKDELRQILYHSGLAKIQPYVDYSVAKREFARQMYKYSPLAQRAGGELRLWFFMEYSDCLKLVTSGYASTTKDKQRSESTQAISTLRNALNAAKTSTHHIIPITIKQLQSDGKDWRFHIVDLLISEAIALVAEAEAGQEQDLIHHTRQFLNAISHYNSITGHSGDYVVLKPPKSSKPKTSGRPRGSKKNMKKY